MDLSKVFDTMPHELIVHKLRQCGADDKMTKLIKDYLFNRRQRVKVGNSLERNYGWDSTGFHTRPRLI